MNLGTEEVMYLKTPQQVIQEIRVAEKVIKYLVGELDITPDEDCEDIWQIQGSDITITCKAKPRTHKSLRGETTYLVAFLSVCYHHVVYDADGEGDVLDQEIDTDYDSGADIVFDKWVAHQRDKFRDGLRCHYEMEAMVAIQNQCEEP